MRTGTERNTGSPIRRVVADSLQFGPRVFNSYAWGGCISWSRSGRYKVFIDGRCIFGSDTRADWMLLPQESPLVGAAPLTRRWRVAYRDSMAAILTPVPAPGPAR